jgi:histidinol-phosphate aminotransferase
MSGLEERVRTLLRPEVLALSAYHVPDSKGYIKLDAMENPYSWPEGMIEAWLDRLRRAEPNRYPDPACGPLKAALRSANDIPAEAELLLGNGSDEIIQIILMALPPGSTVLAPEPTFVMYRQISLSLGLRFVGVPLREDFSLDARAMEAAIISHRPAVVFLAYPNNPTGNLFEEDAMLRVLAAAPGWVVVDEAYAPYAEATFMPRLSEFDNLLVMRTLSKLGLAGLRLGFLAGAREWIEQLDKIRLPYNINVLTQISAQFAMENQPVFEGQVRSVLRDRQWLAEELGRLSVVRVYPSRANFILFKLLSHEASEVFQALKEAGILVKNLHPAGGSLSQCLRLTVGTPDENRCFLKTLREIIAL